MRIRRWVLDGSAVPPEKAMDQSFTVVMLAGALERSPIQQQLTIPTLCLPVGHHGTLLDAWLATIRRSGRCRHVRIVVNSEEDAQALRRLITTGMGGGARGPEITVMAEPAPWRGTGGLLRDITQHQSNVDTVVAIEAHCLPPLSLRPLFRTLNGDVEAVVGAGAGDEPAGVYAFRRTVLNPIRSFGYFDLKEQLLPALYDQGRIVRVVRISDRVFRLRDQVGYIEAVGASLNGTGRITIVSRRSPESRIARSARIVSGSIVEGGAVIEDQAIIHASIVLNGALVESGAIVSRSIVGPGAVVPARARLIASYQRGNDSVRPKAVAI